MAQTTFRSIVTTSVIIVIACFGIGYFVTTPQWSKYRAAQDQLAKLQSENLRLTQALASVKSFLETYNARQKDVATVNLTLPLKSSDLGNFAASIDELAKSSGVVLSNISIESSPAGSTAVDNSIQAVPINLTASGGFASFKDFMIRLQTHLRIIDVGHITLKSDTNGIIQYQINLKTYYQK